MKKILWLMLLISGSIAQAQSFPSLNWRYPLPAPAFGSAASADVDGDGLLEIIFTTYTNDGKAHCLNAEDGTQLWEYNIGGCGDVAPIIYDLDGDDTLDVFINGSCNPTCFCLNAMTGRLKWSQPSGGGDSPPTVGDIDGDGKPEVLFGNFSGQVRILNGEDGSTNRTITLVPGIGPIQTEPTLGDLDGDGDLDFIVCNYNNQSGHYTWAYDYDTDDTLWMNYKFDTTSLSYAYHGGVLADVDGDSLLEYVIGDNAGMIRCLNAEDGSVLWADSGLTNVISALACANFDSDPALEIVYSNNDYLTFNDHIGVLDGMTGALEWSYPVTFSAFRGMAISDLNGNGKLDCVGGCFMGDVIAVEPFTGLVWKYDSDSLLPPGLPYWQVDHGPVIADFDQNGTMDVFVVSGYGTYTPDSQNVGVAFCINAGTNADRCPQWLMFRQDVHRTGYLSEADINENCLLLHTESPEPMGLKVYPNPNAGQFWVECPATLPDGGEFSLWDAQGRQVHRQRMMPSSNRVELTLPAGIYYWRASSGATTETRKLVIGKP